MPIAPGPRVIGWRGTSASRDQVIPPVVDALAGIDCTVCGQDAPALDVVVTVGAKHYRLDITAAIAALVAQIRADLAAPPKPEAKAKKP